MSAKTSYLLAGTDAGSKLEKAQQHKVTILDEAAFDALLAAVPPQKPGDSFALSAD